MAQEQETKNREARPPREGQGQNRGPREGGGGARPVKGLRDAILLMLVGGRSTLGQLLVSLTWASSSAKPGRSDEYSTLRPNSTAMEGA